MLDIARLKLFIMLSICQWIVVSQKTILFESNGIGNIQLEYYPKMNHRLPKLLFLNQLKISVLSRVDHR